MKKPQPQSNTTVQNKALSVSRLTRMIAHTKALTAFCSFGVLVKAVVILFLFIWYPNLGLLTQSMEQDLIDLTNESRIEAGLPPLAVNEVLSAAAERKVVDMLRDGYFAHVSPDGIKPYDWIDTDLYDYEVMGENLALDFSSATIVHTALMHSPTHRSNILHPKYTDVGVAIISGEFEGRNTLVLAEFFGNQATSPSLVLSTAQAQTIPSNETLDLKISAQVVSVDESVSEFFQSPSDVTQSASPQVAVDDASVSQFTPEVTDQYLDVAEDVPIESIVQVSPVKIMSISTTRSFGLVDRIIYWSDSIVWLLVIIVGLLTLLSLYSTPPSFRINRLLQSMVVLVVLLALATFDPHFLQQLN